MNPQTAPLYGFGSPMTEVSWWGRRNEVGWRWGTGAEGTTGADVMEQVTAADRPALGR